MRGKPNETRSADHGIDRRAADADKKGRELALIGRLFERLRLFPESIEPTEAGADAVVTFPEGRVSVEVTEDVHDRDDGDSPQARSARWERLRVRLNACLREARVTGELLLVFQLEDGRPAVPSTRDFDRFGAQILVEIAGWNGKEAAVVAPSTCSPLARWVSEIQLYPNGVLDVASNHQAKFLGSVKGERLGDAIRKKVGRPGTEGERWLLVVCGANENEPTAGLDETPDDFDTDPDPEGVFDRVFLLDAFTNRLLEKSGLPWAEIPRSNREEE
jgi:hypothetical protein